jgi:hypothetical protein
MKVLFVPLITICFFSVLFSTPQTEIQYLSGTGSDDTVDWEFMVTGGRQANEWTTIPVPSNWEQEGFGEYNYGHDMPKADEKGVYKTTFKVPENWRDKTLFIVFEGAMTDTEVQINGQLAGPIHQGGFYRFSYDITDLVKHNDENILQATVAKMSSNERINQAERKADYWVFGGIYRPVYLKAVPKEYIDWTAIDAKANGRFSVDIYPKNIDLVNKVQAQIIDLSGQRVGQVMSKELVPNVKKVVLRAQVSDIKTWTAETPHLYVVDVTLLQDDTPIHTVRERFGFRTIEVREGEGIYLNGQPITLKGVDRHSFWPTTGRALNYSRCLQDVLTLKEMNMNSVRMSHYPPDTYFLDLCDEYGLYVLDELAGWQKPPYDTPTGERLVKQIVMRDVNHPSILFWNNGNEGGWNTELDDEWDKYDPQKRRVLHPWELHGGIDTDHYENYQSTLDKLQSGNIFMPTEYIHGLYDGGLGAGLDDFWKAMWGHPLNGGMFLWVYADEGVVRTDQNGRIDTDGNHAPDGILGPFHEREASFYTIKEIWSPVYIETMDDLPSDFRIPIENRYDFTNMNTCTFEWRLVNNVEPSDRRTGTIELARDLVQGPDIAPRSKGFLKLDIPVIKADALHLTARNANHDELFTWKWPLKSADQITADFIDTGGPVPMPKESENEMIVSAANFEFHFDLTNGRLVQVNNGAATIPFGNGPVFTHAEKESDEKLQWDISKSASATLLKTLNHPDFSTLTWTIYGSGWLELDYSYRHSGEVDVLGISFDFPEKHSREIRYLAKGPYRVWKNRIKGPTLDVYHNTYKNFQVNTAWDYPEFVGYFADFHWAVLYTLDGPITMATDNEDLFLRLFSQPDGEEPRHTAMKWPVGDISFLHAIPAIGTKFKNAEQYGPQSQKSVAKGEYEGTLYFYFGKSASLLETKRW